MATGWLAGALVLVGLAGPVAPAAAATIRSNPTPQVKTDLPGDLTGISCISPDECTAVGWYAHDFTTQTSLAEVWNGATWTVQTTPNPADSTSTILVSDSCLPDGTCVAVGYYANESDQILPLSEVWSGGDWSIVSPPSPTGATDAQLNSVSCVSDTDCTAVGVYNSTMGMAEVLDGESWTVQSTAVPKGSTGNTLNTVDCSGTTCMAVGSYATSSGMAKTLAESSTGTAWKVLTTPNAKGDTFNSFYGLSCTGVSSCLATGYWFDSGAYTSAVAAAATWNGVTWKASKPRKPKGSNSKLQSVSCGPSTCTAIGSYITPANVAVSLAEEWTGTKWVIQKTPAPKDPESYGLLGVSCGGATACVAVGNNLVDEENAIPMAEGWNGAKWALQKMPTP